MGYGLAGGFDLSNPLGIMVGEEDGWRVIGGMVPREVLDTFSTDRSLICILKFTRNGRFMEYKVSLAAIVVGQVTE